MVSNKLNIVINSTKNHDFALEDVPKKSNCVDKEVPGNTTNVIRKQKNTCKAILMIFLYTSKKLDGLGLVLAIIGVSAVLPVRVD